MTELERFKKEVDEAITIGSQKDESNEIFVCNTPQLLISCGMLQLPMLYRKGHLRDAIKEKNRLYHYHGLTLNQIYNLPEMIAHPAIILKNRNYINENYPILIFDDVDSDKMPLFMMIDMNTKGTYELKRINTNEILSIYGREKFEEYLKNTIDKDGLIYYNEKKVQSLDANSEQSLLARCKGFKPYTILQKFNDNVKLNSSNNIKEKYKEKDKLYNEEDSKIIKEIGEHTFLSNVIKNNIDKELFLKLQKNDKLQLIIDDLKESYKRADANCSAEYYFQNFYDLQNNDWFIKLSKQNKEKVYNNGK